MDAIAPHVVSERAEERVRVGKWVTTRDEGNTGTKYLMAHPISVDALKRIPSIGNVLSIRSPLGRAIYNGRVGEEKTYERDDGGAVSVWVVLIEDAPPVWHRSPPEPVVPYALTA